MANAEKTAPLKKEKEFIEIEVGQGGSKERVLKDSKEHKFLLQDFDESRKYVFELANKNPQREIPIYDARAHRQVDHQPFKPYQNLVFTSQIIWNGQRRMVRYYDGCDTIFYDKQPKEKEIIDQMVKATRRREFVYGKLGVQGYERMLLLYMLVCSWNVLSAFRTSRANTIFLPVNSEQEAENELQKLDDEEMALKYAREASFTKMKVHASYLGISLMDFDSNSDLTEKELRVKYRRFAVENSKEFLKSFGNEKIEIKYYIDRALVKGILTNRDNPHKIVWGNSGTVVCDVSGLTTHDAIAQRIFEFSQREEGEEFLIQLKSLAEEF